MSWPESGLRGQGLTRQGLGTKAHVLIDPIHEFLDRLALEMLNRSLMVVEFAAHAF